MTQVVQAKCPHCSNVLRIPAEWLGKSMRCKLCKNTFQAQAKNSASASANVMAAAPAKASTPVAKPANVSQSAPVAAKPATAIQPVPAVAQPVNAIQPAPAVAAPVFTAPGALFDFPEDAPAAPSGAKPRKKGRGMGLLVLTFFILFLLGASGASFFVYKVATTPGDKSDSKAIAKVEDRPSTKTSPGKIVPDLEEKQDDPGMTKKESDPPEETEKPKKPLPKKDLPKKVFPKKDVTKKDGIKTPSPFSNDPFPRRALLISVNNYLMFNPVHYGSGQDMFKGGYPGSSTAVLRDRLTRPPMYFPTSQVTELSDGVPPESKISKPHPTQKVILETTVRDFVDTCREQDRALLFFAGHGAHVEDKSYLIPIDGNLTNTDTLIPLKWVYDQLAKCKAQQKILILDVFRYSPSRGFELPGAGEGDEGAMPEGFDKDLQNPPAGIQVWCSCQKEQSAVELEGGSAFIQALCHSMVGGAEMKGISGPTQPIPVEDLVVRVNQRLKDLLLPEKRSQMSRLTGKAMEGGIVFDPKEPLPPAVTLKLPADEGGDRAGYAQVNKILDELKLLPPVRDTRIGEINLLKAQNLPAFSVKKLDSYKQDGYQTVPELVKRYKDGKEAFAKEFPLRAAVFDAVEALQESNKIQMREVLPGPINPKSKALFLQEQAAPGISIFKLEQVLATVNAAAEERDKETSKRWQANFDYTLARMQSRLVYLFEYSYTLGQIRADNLPDLAPGQSGWRIGTGKKIAVTESKAKALSKSTTKLWKRIQDEYPGTPWALLAQRESMIALGLQWRPKSD